MMRGESVREMKVAVVLARARRSRLSQDDGIREGS